MCIADNASFCSGGGHTLVETNYVHVTCSVYGNFFRFASLLGIVLCNTPTYTLFVFNTFRV